MAKMAGPRPESERGRRGEKGERGERGERGEPGYRPEQIAQLIDVVEHLQDESVISIKRIADIQAQLDKTLKALQDLGSKAGRQRKRRSR